MPLGKCTREECPGIRGTQRLEYVDKENDKWLRFGKEDELAGLVPPVDRDGAEAERHQNFER